MVHDWKRTDMRWEDGTGKRTLHAKVLHCSRCGVEGAVVGPLGNIRIVPIVGHRTYEDVECESVPDILSTHAVMES